MPVSFEQEKAAIAAEEKRLAERRKKLAEREDAERLKAIGKSVLAKLDRERLDTLLQRIKALGIDEVEKRLAANG